MLSLSTEHIRMHQQAADKEEALQLFADILAADGLAMPEYLNGLQAREAQTSTYLGQGMAIPHGTPESRSTILNTGVRLIHFPEGVVWNGTDKAYLAVVIAAKSDEHLQVLQLLTRALSEDIEEGLRTAQTPEQILALLNAGPESLMLHENLLAADIEAADTDDVLYQATALLKKQKVVDTGFLSALKPKEAVHLQEDIWCITAEEAVLQPAVAIVKLKQALPFRAGRLAVLVCVAANDKLDLQRLSHLMDVLFTPKALQNSHSRRELALAVGAETVPDWQSASVVLANAHGLHARPATALANVCKEFDGEVRVSADGGGYVSAKSLTKLLSLGAGRGQTLTFIAEPGTAAEAGLAQIIQAVRSGLGEEVEAVEASKAETAQSSDAFVVAPVVLQDDVRNQGVAASAGLAAGMAHMMTEPGFHYEVNASDAAAERIKLQEAIGSVKAELAQWVAEAKSKDIRLIFTAHAALLDDPELLQQVDEGIGRQFSAAAAWHKHVEALAKEQESLNNPLLAERAADLRDVGNKVLAALCGVKTAAEPDEPYILVMEDVVPSVVARLNQERVAGILTAGGGASSHSAIVARALGIPAVVGAGEAVLSLAEGSRVLLNGEDGAFYLNPSQARVDEAMHQRAQMQEQRALAEAHCMEAAVPSDGLRIEVAANLGKVQDAATAVKRGAEAIGLLRTELVFMSHSAVPDEVQQEQDYRVVFDAMGDKPVVVRTLDVGGDKPLPYLPLPKEANPFLGERGLRMTLRRPQLLRQQLSALLKAADGRPLRIMFPMVGRLEEWHAAKAILDEVLAKTPCENLQVGVMIEVPSAALIAGHLAAEVDFFSIGTNDLTQYVLAIDRGHPILSAEADGLHPSILQLISHTVAAAHRHGKWVGVCGELAADSKAVPILLGLGVDELSVSSGSIPMVKAQVRRLNAQTCRQMAEEALTLATAGEVRSLSGRNG